MPSSDSACPIVDKTMPASFSTGVYFTIGNEDLAAWIDHARSKEGADLIVVLSHLGFPQDVKLAGEVGGIDILVSGHTHNRMKEPIVVNGAIIFQSGCHGSFIGRLDVTVEGGTISAHRHGLVPIDEHGPRKPGQVRSMVDEALAGGGRSDARSRGDRHRATPSLCNDQCADGRRAARGDYRSSGATNVGFSNGWRYGAPIPAGAVTVNDLWNIIPTNPPISVVDLTGDEIEADARGQSGGHFRRQCL